MLRPTLALLLAAALVLGWTGAIAAAGCGAPTGGAAMVVSAFSGGCGACEDKEDQGQPQQGCAVLACSAGCASGPVTPSDAAHNFVRAMAAGRAAEAPPIAVVARSIPPDHPPPR